MSGASALSREQALGVLRALIGIDFLGGLITLNSDGSITVGAELLAAVEQLLATLAGAVTGIIDAIADPQAVLEGLGKLVYFSCMVQLANYGHPGAKAYVDRVLAAIAAELGAAMRGVVALQENAPGGDELVRDIARAIQWRVTWEVLGLFVGVGEASALIKGIRAGRGAAAIGEAASVLGNVGRSTHLADDAARLADDAARLADDAARAADDAARLADDAARARRRRGAARRRRSPGRRRRSAARRRRPRPPGRRRRGARRRARATRRRT